MVSMIPDDAQGYLLPPNGQSHHAIDTYIAAGGYQAAQKAWREMQPEEIQEVVKASGLRGRGGAGACSIFDCTKVVAAASSGKIR